MASKGRLDRAAGASIGGFFSNVPESPEKQEEKPTVNRSEKRQQDIEAFLEQLRQGKNQKEASEAVGHDKTWGSHVIAELKEKEPERLKGTPQEVKEAEEAPQDKPQDAQEPQKAAQTEQTIKSTLAEEKTEEKADAKAQKQVFSFRASKEHISDWKAYATATGLTMENVGAAAMNEYLLQHKLEGAEKAVYDALRAKNNM